ncbi:hypothetical protein CHUAL_007365 [Chamberlinius hualienensis]
MIGIMLISFFGWLFKKVLIKETKRNSLLYWIKYIAIYYKARKIIKQKQPILSYAIGTNDLRKLGVFNPEDVWEKDRPRPIPAHPHGADIIDIWGGDEKGNLLMISIWRRPNRVSEVSLYLKLSNGDIYQLPFHPDTVVCHTDGKSFSAAGLNVEVHEPLRRCRITFNGQLRKGIKQKWAEVDDDNIVNVRFCFTYHPSSYYRSFQNFYDASMVADFLAQSEWTKDFLKNPQLVPFENFENWGHWYGRINIENDKEQRLLLRGSRERRYGVLDWNNVKQWAVIKGYTKKGTGLHIEVNNTINSTNVLNGQPHNKLVKNIVNGYVTIPFDVTKPYITKLNWDIDNWTSSAHLPSSIKFDFKTSCKELYKFSATVDNNQGFRVFGGLQWKSEILVSPISFKLHNGDSGYGFIYIAKPHEKICPIIRPPVLPLIKEPDLPKTTKLVVNLEDSLCQGGQLVGGKGASLAHLKEIRKELLDDDIKKFSIPDGVCVTKYGFELLLNRNEKVKSAISHLVDVAGRKICISLEDVCKSCVELISKTQIPDEVRQDVAKELEKLFGQDVDNNKFAIRSSAIGEDGEDLSSAGQNETYLGIQGIDNICESIVKCWASQFSFRSVEYRRQNGQIIDGEMGVVVQVMIPADSAGVLFSRDPLTGNSSSIIITSNYGLGESVVSALSDPDTIVVRRSFQDDLEIAQKQIGAKNLKMIISESGGTINQDISHSEKAQCSINDHLILKLAQIAIYLEKRYGNARDLEWAIIQDHLYILQSRPVTTGAAITDDEIMHEFDSGLRTDFEARTKANIGEVMPGALTPLTQTADRRVHGACFQKNPFFASPGEFDPTFSGPTVFYYNHQFFDRIFQKTWHIEEKKSLMTKSFELGFFGRVMDDDEELEKIALERFPFPGYIQKIMSMVFPFLGMVIGKRFLRGAEVKYRHFPVHAEGAKTAKEAFDLICEKIMNIDEILTGHVQVLMGSNLWNFIILKLLAGNSPDFTMDHYHDFAMLVGSCNGAESGDVPFSITELANLVIKSTNYENFSQLKPQEALNKLNEDKGTIGEKFRQFLERHGHRGIREFEMRSPSWGMEPEGFVKILQNTVRGSTGQLSLKNPILTVNEAINNIKTKIGFFRRKLLAFAISRCKSGVCYREQAKSMMIKVEERLKMSFCLLAKLMVNEGFLPDTDLIYFLTFEEVGIVLNTRSSSLLARAQRRRRLYDKMDSIKFDECGSGFPDHWDKEEESDDISNSTLELKAYPVCHGSVKGIVRVITSLDDAHQIQKGDILITHSTDIGWSPYFPLLSGIVTELGGLISHGAVVAREYGLPCLIAATKATQLFKSGDHVHLDSNNGILRKLNASPS